MAGHNIAYGTYATLIDTTHRQLNRKRQSREVKVNGEMLDIASVVAVSRYAHSPPNIACEEYPNHLPLSRFDIEPKLDESLEFRNRINASVATLNELLSEGQTIYGRSPLYSFSSASQAGIRISRKSGRPITRFWNRGLFHVSKGYV